MKRTPLFIALLIYSFLSIATLYLWHSRGINTVTGDEPHYLVMSSGLINHGTLEQTIPYKEEFIKRAIFESGLAPKDDQPSPSNTHGVLGPNGLFNVHNIGLPILLALPFFLGGVLGAKLFMLFCGSLIVAVSLKFSSRFSVNKLYGLLAVIGAVISQPLIPASNQIYPDILAGLISLIGLYWFLTVSERRSSCNEALLAAAIVFLPWLQIKFAATCVVLVSAIVGKIYLQSKDMKRITIILAAALFSCLFLAAYNYYAFGKITGPYKSSALEVSKTSLMVLFGLHLDQNQGFILHNPLNLIGILSIGWMYQINRGFSLVWALVFLSLIVPNALHPTWYGGWSISGRFQWAASIVFAIPTIYGLIAIANTKKYVFGVLVFAGLTLQLYFFYRYAIDGVGLFNKGQEIWPDAYGLLYYPLDKWLPMLYDVDWAYDYWPNYAWILLASILLIGGFIRKKAASKVRGKESIVGIVLFFILALIFFSGLLKNPKNKVAFPAGKLPSQIGTLDGSARYANVNYDKLGFLNFGPYYKLRSGSFEVVFTYSSTVATSESIGWFDIYNASTGVQIGKEIIFGTAGRKKYSTISFESNHYSVNAYEFRTHWGGKGDIRLESIELRLAKE